LDKIPFEEQRIIDELVKLWQTRYEPRDLAMHIDKLPSTLGRHIVRNFFRQVYEDLRTDKRSSYATFSASLSIVRDGRPMTTDKCSNYAAFSASEFKRLLETEYSQWVQTHAEHQALAKADAEGQAQAKAKEREEYVRKARADFDALGKEMAKATSRAELVKLGRKRADLAQYIGVSSGDYESHCWRSCPSRISSAVHARCPACGWYICNNCSSCSPDCNWNGTLNPVQDKTVNPFLDMPDDFIL